MRKKIILIVLMFLSINFSFGQPSKGSLLVGANARFSLNTDDNSYIFFNPNSAYFVANNFCLGLNIPLLLNSDGLYFGLTPFARLYKHYSENSSLFFSAYIPVANYFEGVRNIITHYGGIGLGIGHSWFIKENVSFEIELTGTTNFTDIWLNTDFGFKIYI